MASTSVSAIAYRLMREDDLAMVMAVQLEAYGPGFIEAPAVLAQRLALAPDTAWVAIDDGKVCAYLVACPSRRGQVTSLGEHFCLPETPDCLYLHDLAVSGGVAGRGVGQALVSRAHAYAADAGLEHSALVSVQSSSVFWARLGYTDKMAPGDEMAKLDSYPGGAVYMSRCAGST